MSAMHGANAKNEGSQSIEHAKKASCQREGLKMLRKFPVSELLDAWQNKARENFRIPLFHSKYSE